MYYSVQSNVHTLKWSQWCSGL